MPKSVENMLPSKFKALLVGVAQLHLSGRNLCDNTSEEVHLSTVAATVDT